MNRPLWAALLLSLFASAALALTPPLAEQKTTPTPGDLYETVLRMLDYFPGYLILGAMDRYNHPEAILLFLLLVRPSFVAGSGFLVSEIFRRFPKTLNIQARLARHRPLPVFLGFLCAAVLSNLVLILFKYERASVRDALALVTGWAVFVGLLVAAWLVYLYKSAKSMPERKFSPSVWDWAWPAGMAAVNAALLAIIFS